MHVRIPLPVLLTGPLLAWAATAVAEEPGRVSLQLASVPLRAALGQLQAAGAPAIDVDPGVPDVPVTLNVRAVPWATALRSLARAASGPGRSIEFQRSGESYRLTLRAAPATPVEVVAPAERPLFLNRGSIQFKNAPLRQVLRRIAAETRVRSQVEPQVEDAAVSVHLYGRPASELVAATLEAAGAQSPGLRYVWDGDHYVIWKCGHGYEGTRRPDDEGNEPEPVGGQRIERITLRYASVFQLSDLLGAEIFGSGESQPRPLINSNGAYVGREPGAMPPEPGNAAFPTINPSVLTGLCRYARCGPRFAREGTR